MHDRLIPRASLWDNWNENRNQLKHGEEIIAELKEELISNINQFSITTASLQNDLAAKDDLFKLEITSLDIKPLQSTVEKTNNLGIIQLTSHKPLNDSVFISKNNPNV